MKKILFTTFLITCFCITLFAQVTENENGGNNNTYLGSSVVTINQFTTYTGDIGTSTSDPNDFWKFPNGSNGTLNVAFTFTGGSSNPKVAILEASDLLSEGSVLYLVSKGNNQNITLDSNKYYYLKVFTTVVTSGPYTINITTNSGATLPVELSSFTAVLCNTNNVALNWTSQSESNLLGYNVYRSSTNDQMSAVKVNASTIQATNTSTEHSYEFIDAQINEGEYYYWLQTVEQNNEYAFYGPVTVNYSSNPGTPDPQYQYKHRLVGAYPNPFNPNTSIRYEVQGPTNVKIEIFNNKGQKVASYQKYHAAKGSDAFNWNGKDFNGKTVSTGVYFSTMTAGKYQETKKMIMMK